MKDGDKLLAAIERRNNVKMLLALLMSPAYEVESEDVHGTFILYILDGTEDIFCCN